MEANETKSPQSSLQCDGGLEGDGVPALGVGSRGQRRGDHVARPVADQHEKVVAWPTYSVP